MNVFGVFCVMITSSIFYGILFFIIIIIISFHFVHDGMHWVSLLFGNLLSLGQT